LDDETEAMISRALEGVAGDDRVMPRRPRGDEPASGQKTRADLMPKQSRSAWEVVEDTAHGIAIGAADSVGGLGAGASSGILTAAAQGADLLDSPNAAEWMRFGADYIKSFGEIGSNLLTHSTQQRREVKETWSYKGGSAVAYAIPGLGAARATLGGARLGWHAHMAIMAGFYGMSLTDTDQRIQQAIDEGNRRRIAAGMKPVDGQKFRDAVGAHFNAFIETGVEYLGDKVGARLLAKSGAMRSQIGRFFAAGGAEGGEEWTTSQLQDRLVNFWTSPNLHDQMRREAISRLNEQGIDPFAPGADAEKLITAQVYADIAVRGRESFMWGAVGGTGGHLLHRSADAAGSIARDIGQVVTEHRVGSRLRERAYPVGDPRNNESPVSETEREAPAARMTEAEFAARIAEVRDQGEGSRAAVRIDPDTLNAIGFDEDSIDGLELASDPGSGDTIVFDPRKVSREDLETLLTPLEKDGVDYGISKDAEGNQALMRIPFTSEEERTAAWKRDLDRVERAGGTARRVKHAEAEMFRKEQLEDFLGGPDEPGATHEILERDERGDVVRSTPYKDEPMPEGSGGGAVATIQGRAQRLGRSIEVVPFSEQSRADRETLRGQVLESEAKRRASRAAAEPDPRLTPARVQQALQYAAQRVQSETGKPQMPRVVADHKLTPGQAALRQRYRQSGGDIVYYDGLAMPAFLYPPAPNTAFISTRGAPGTKSGAMSELQHDAELLAHEHTHRLRATGSSEYQALANVLSSRAIGRRMARELMPLVEAGQVEAKKDDESVVRWIDRITHPDYKPGKGKLGGPQLAAHLVEEAVAYQREGEARATGAGAIVGRTATPALRRAVHAARRSLTRLGLRGRFASRALEQFESMLAPAPGTDAGTSAPARDQMPANAPNAGTGAAQASRVPATRATLDESPMSAAGVEKDATDSKVSTPRPRARVVTAEPPVDSSAVSTAHEPPPEEAGWGEFPRREAPPIAFGAETTIITGTRESFRGWWGAIEAEDLQASNLSTRANGRGGFPRNQVYDDKNERAADYENPVSGSDSIQVVRTIGAAPVPEILVNNSPEPVTGAPIITRSGTVLGGNARTMGMQLAYADGNGGPIRDALNARAAEFGLDPRMVAAMKQPVLVRMIENPGSPGELSRVLNERLQAGKSSAVDAASRAASMPEDVARWLSALVSDDEGSTLRGTMREMSIEQHRTLGAMLQRAGVWSQSESARWIDADGRIDPEGVDVLESMLTALAIDGPDVPGTLVGLGSGGRGKLAAAAPRIMAAAAAGNPGAADLRRGLYWAAASRPARQASGLSIGDYHFDQAQIMPPPWHGDPVVATLAEALEGIGPRKFAEHVGGVLERTTEGLFGGEPMPLPQAVGEAMQPSRRIATAAGPLEGWKLSTPENASKAASMGIKFSRQDSEESRVVDLRTARPPTSAGRYRDADGNEIAITERTIDATSEALRPALPELIKQSSGSNFRRVMARTAEGLTRVHLSLNGGTLQKAHLVPAKKKTTPAESNLAAGGRPGLKSIVDQVSAFRKDYPAGFGDAAAALLERLQAAGLPIVSSEPVTTPATETRPRRDSLYVHIDWAPRPRMLRLSDHARSSNPSDSGFDWTDSGTLRGASWAARVEWLASKFDADTGIKFSRAAIDPWSLRLGLDADGFVRVVDGDGTPIHAGRWLRSEQGSAERFLDRLHRELIAAEKEHARLRGANEQMALGFAAGDVAPMSDAPRREGESEVDFRLRQRFRDAELNTDFLPGFEPKFSRAQTETPAFKAWFGDSKVVNADGSPMVVYHGTTADFAEFDHSRANDHAGTGVPLGAMFFTDSPEVAESYTKWQGEWISRFNDGANVMPSYLAIERPLVVDAKGERWSSILWKNEWMTLNELVQRVLDAGPKYDGVIVRNVVDRGSPGTPESRPASTYVVFDPTQIKSAISNRGTFSPFDPDIRFSRAERMIPESEALRAVLKGQEKAAAASYRVAAAEAEGKWRAARTRFQETIKRLEGELKARTASGRRQADDLRNLLMEELRRIPVEVRGRQALLEHLRTVNTPEDFDAALARAEYEVSTFGLRREARRVRRWGATLKHRAKRIGEDHRAAFMRQLAAAEEILFGPAPLDGEGFFRAKINRDARDRQERGIADPKLGRVMTPAEALRADAAAHWERVSKAGVAFEEAQGAYAAGRWEQHQHKELRRQTIREAATSIAEGVKSAKDPIGPSHGRLLTDRAARLLDKVADTAADLRTLAAKVEGRTRGMLNAALVVRPRRAESAMLAAQMSILDEVHEAAKAAGWRDLSHAMQMISGTHGDANRSYINARLGGRMHRITLGEALGLVALDPDSRRLLEDEGFITSEGSTPVQFGEGRQREAIPVSLQEIEELETALPPGQVAFVAKLKEILETRIRPDLFRRHRELNGFEPPLVENYWPRIRNRDQVVELSADASTQEVTKAFFENAGFLKERQGGGALPIVAGDLLDVFLDHVDQALRVIHFAKPLRMADTLLRRPELVQAVNDRWGTEANNRLRKMLHNGMGITPSQREPMGSLMQRAYGNLARSALPLNVATWIRQLGGIGKLLHTLDFNALVGGFMRAVTSNWNAKEYGKLWKHSGYMHRRQTAAAAQRWTQNRDDRMSAIALVSGASRLGSAARSLRAGDVGDSFRNLSASMDAIRTLNVVDRFIAMTAFEAARIMARKKRRGAPPEWIDRWAARKAEEAFRDTQNVSSPLDDPSLIANSKTWAPIVFPFSSDPIKSWNMLVSSRRRGKAAFARAVTAVGMNMAWGAAAGVTFKALIQEAAISAFGDDDEGRRRRRWNEYLARVGDQIMQDVAGMFWGGTYILDAAGMLGGERFAEFNSGVIGSVSNPISQGLREAGRYMRGEESKQKSFQRKVLDALSISMRIAGAVTGQPFTPIVRDAMIAPLNAIEKSIEGGGGREELKLHESERRKLIAKQNEALREGRAPDPDEQSLLVDIEARIDELEREQPPQTPEERREARNLRREQTRLRRERDRAAAAR